MNILYVCGHDPREKGFGGQQRTNLLWQALQQIGHVYTICYYPSEGYLTDSIVAVNILQPKGIKSYVNRAIRRIWDCFDLQGKKILPVSNEFSIHQPFLNVKFDAVVCRYMEPAALFHLWRIAPLYIDVDDHPLQAFDTRDKLVLTKWQRPIASLLQKLEFKILESKTTGGWISNPEQVRMCHFSKPAIALKNIPQKPSCRYDVDSLDRDYIFSVGFMQYQPNYMGVDNFVMNIWPKVYEKHPKLRYFIVGKGAPEEYVAKWASVSGVKYLGFVEDLELIYEHCLATVVAVDQGSGTCIKTLESMAYSRMCLARPFGVRGIEREALDGEHGLFVYHTASDFLQSLERVMNIEFRRKQEKTAAQFIEKYYSKAAFYEQVRHAFL